MVASVPPSWRQPRFPECSSAPMLRAHLHPTLALKSRTFLGRVRWFWEADWKLTALDDGRVSSECLVTHQLWRLRSQSSGSASWRLLWILSKKIIRKWVMSCLFSESVLPSPLLSYPFPGTHLSTTHCTDTEEKQTQKAQNKPVFYFWVASWEMAPFIRWWTLGYFHVGAIVNSATIWTFTYKLLCEYTFLNILGCIYWRWGLPCWLCGKESAALW